MLQIKEAIPYAGSVISLIAFLSYPMVEIYHYMSSMSEGPLNGLQQHQQCWSLY